MSDESNEPEESTGPEGGFVAVYAAVEVANIVVV